MAFSNWSVLRWTPRRICFSVNSANQHSTRFSQEAEGGEVQVKAWTFGKPTANQLRFMRAVVVQDEVHLDFCGHVALDGIEKSAKLARAMTAMELAQHAAAGHVESGEQAGGAVPLVVVSVALDLSRAHGSRGAVRSKA
jgi:hypothetical protein